MSELKVYSQCYDGTDGLFYLKSEADKVIKDLIEKNKRLANKDMIMASETIKGVFDALRHQKYKRCLAMASSCSDKASAEYASSYVSCDEYYYHHAEFWVKWEKRWLELADKFKEAKWLCNQNVYQSNRIKKGTT